MFEIKYHIFSTYIYLADYTISITTRATFDREAQDTYGMIFKIIERRNGNTGVGTSTVTITITDVNDWPHKPTTKEMVVYAYEGMQRYCRSRLIGMPWKLQKCPHYADIPMNRSNLHSVM